MVGSRSWTVTAAFLISSAAVVGCAARPTDRGHVEAGAQLRGVVRTEHESDAPLVVVLFTEASVRAESGEDLEVVDHFMRAGPGSYAFAVPPGAYRVVAFEDANADGNYDPEEPLLRADGDGSGLELAPGAVLERDLVIPTDGRPRNPTAPVDVAALQERSRDDQTATSVGELLIRGEVADLADEKFGPASGRLGLWEPLNFLMRVGAGIYLAEPYDPDRIPVLFVHGIAGYPQEFAPLVDAIDSSRFQAWFYFYPSSARLDALARRGAELVSELQFRHGFRDFAVVAHGTGGLVARSLIFHQLQSGRSGVGLLVTLSTPWGGEPRALERVENSHVVVDAWRDLTPNSPFLKTLFWDPVDPARPRVLPDDVAWHLFFGNGGESEDDRPIDGVFTVATLASPEAWGQARDRRPFDETHAGILASDETGRLLAELLAETFD